MNTAVRSAKIEDAQCILNIYSYYVKNTAITFEYDVPALLEFQRRMKETMKKYPYLVIERDGIIQGYAYAGVFKGRAAYDWSCELTIYIDCKARKCGLGRKLYDALEAELRDMGILNLYACIAYPIVEKEALHPKEASYPKEAPHPKEAKLPWEYLTKNSAEFHAHMGFTKVGEFHQCGYKFGHWYDMIWMEKIIGKHQENQPYVKFSGD